MNPFRQPQAPVEPPPDRTIEDYAALLRRERWQAVGKVALVGSSLVPFPILAYVLGEPWSRHVLFLGLGLFMYLLMRWNVHKRSEFGLLKQEADAQAFVEEQQRARIAMRVRVGGAAVEEPLEDELRDLETVQKLQARD